MMLSLAGLLTAGRVHGNGNRQQNRMFWRGILGKDSFSFAPLETSMADNKVRTQHTTPRDSLARFHGVSEDGEMHRRPRLLFLAYPFPPLRSTACVRTWNIAKHLARLGWDIIVVTPHPSVWRRLDNPEEMLAALDSDGIRRIFTDHRWRCLSPDHLSCWNQGLGWLVGGVCRKIVQRLSIDKEIGWLKAAEWACTTVSAKDIDVILATGTPFAAFRLAERLSARLGCPYVLDYRDPWTGNPHASRPARPAIIREEARLLAGCAAATIVSPSWGLAMAHQFGVGAKVHVITNGYDPEELKSVKPYDFGHFAVVYAGDFYPPKRVISPIMATLERLQEIMKNGQCGAWFFHYYGGDENHVQEEAQRFGVMERVRLHGSVPRTEALSAVRGANVAVVITSIAEEATMADKGIVPGKMFEILGLGTPMLLVAPPESDVATIAEGTGLARRFTGGDISGMAAYLTDAMGGQAPELRDRETYAWTNIVKKMERVLCTALGLASRNA